MKLTYFEGENLTGTVVTPKYQTNKGVIQWLLDRYVPSLDFPRRHQRIILRNVRTDYGGAYVVDTVNVTDLLAKINVKNPNDTDTVLDCYMKYNDDFSMGWEFVPSAEKHFMLVEPDKVSFTTFYDLEFKVRTRIAVSFEQYLVPREYVLFSSPVWALDGQYLLTPHNGGKRFGITDTILVSEKQLTILQ